tara:strand:+ start:5137 stop:5817 length:681 start_codon:yes stop_codon:yes gene_type:complete
MENISLVTLATDNLPYKEATVSNKKSYCEKHNYNFVLFSESLDEDRPAPWGKIKALQKTLDDVSTHWAVWIDADAFIMNDEIKLESIIDDEYDLIIAVDCFTINTGVFLLKNTKNSKHFLKEVYEKNWAINHPWWEQAAIIEYINEPNSLKVKTITQKDINAYPPIARESVSEKQQWTRTRNELFFYNKERADKGIYEQGDFILHFAGFNSQEEKMKNINEYIDNG